MQINQPRIPNKPPIKITTFRLPFLKLISLGFVFSLLSLFISAIAFILVFGWMISPGGMLFGVIFFGFGIHIAVALIVILFAYRLLRKALTKEYVESPGLIAITYLASFVMATITSLRILDKTGYSDIDPSSVGLKGISDSTVLLITACIGIFGLLLLAVIQEKANARSYTRYLILIFPLFIWSYSSFFFSDFSDLRTYNINMTSSEEIRKGEQLDWYIAPSQNPFQLVAKDECMIIENARYIECVYGAENSRSITLRQLIAVHRPVMEAYLYKDGVCDVITLKRIAKQRFDENRTTAYWDSRGTSVPCSYFDTPDNIRMYYQTELDRASRKWQTYFIKNETVVIMEYKSELISDPAEKAVQNKMASYVDSFK